MMDPSKIEEDQLYPIEQLIPKPRYSFTSQYLANYRVFSPAMEKIFIKLGKMAMSPSVPLLVKGSTGSGKEVVARYMHHEVDKSSGEYIAVNCTNMNKEIFESELFGYNKGAFTGASSAGHEGYIKQAKNGTLFLDEISEIDLDIQAKLLRVLEEGEYYKLGSSKKEEVQARLIFASNKNLAQMVENGRLREDLYYRLNVVGVEIPGLKDRKEEIFPLACYFINRYNEKFQKQVKNIEGKVLQFFYSYNWPGNIRELNNFITQIMIFIDGNTIRFDHLEVKDEMDRVQTQSQSGDFSRGHPRSQSEIIDEIIENSLDLEGFTRQIVMKTLQKFNGNKAKTARFLGLKREQLYNRYKINK